MRADVDVNTNNNGGVIDGTELLIVNLPGYATIPEFPTTNMYGGEDLFNPRKQIQIAPICE